MADVPLIVQAREDPDAFARFYDAYDDRLLAFFARRVLQAEVAFDLMAETFAKAFEARRQFRGTSAAEEQGWLFVIARNELHGFVRRGRLERDALQRLGIVPVQLTDADIERIEELVDFEALAPGLAAAMRSLPDDQAQAVHLRVVAGMPYAALAAELSTTQQVARARVSRGLRALAVTLPAAAEGVG